MAILAVQNLRVLLGGRVIIKDLSFSVQKGETVIILGPNGAGKTVLLKTLLGLIKPQRGAIAWEGNPKIGYIPQTVNLPPDFPLTVEEFFSLKRSSKSQRKKVFSLLSISQKNYWQERIASLSPGQFQRLLIAWVLISQPEVLLFDEPTSGVDVGGQKTIYSLLEVLKKENNLTILLVTHDLNIVYALADNVVCLNKKILCYGRPKEVISPDGIANLYGAKVKFYKHSHLL